jgi:hypothetical protein
MQVIGEVITCGYVIDKEITAFVNVMSRESYLALQIGRKLFAGGTKCLFSLVMSIQICFLLIT